ARVGESRHAPVRRSTTDSILERVSPGPRLGSRFRRSNRSSAQGVVMVTRFRIAATFFCFAGLTAAAHGAGRLQVDTKGVTARILYEAPINGGHLGELTGKYKMRITEISIAPGGH